MDYYLSSFGQPPQPNFALRCSPRTGQVGPEGQASSLLPTRSEWSARRPIITTSTQKTTLGFEENSGYNSDYFPPQEQQGMDGGGGLRVYPERMGAQDCMYYMRTGTCGYGQHCKFNHPPLNGGRATSNQSIKVRSEHPERPGQPDCQYYLKTGTCKFGATCKYNHPRVKPSNSPQPPLPALNSLNYPLRPGERECAYYMRTRQCKYGLTCRYHHPPLSATGGNGPLMSGLGALSTGGLSVNQFSSTPHLPVPVGPLPPWHVRSLTRFPLFSHQPVQYMPPPSSHSHLFPPQVAISRAQPLTHSNPNSSQHAGPSQFFYTPGPASVGPGNEHLPSGGSGGGGGGGTTVPPFFAAPGAHFMSGSVPCGTMGMPPAQAAAGGGGGGGGGMMVLQLREFPERPGQLECSYYMRTGDCKFGMTCRFHHPKDRGAPTAQCVLSSMGLPLRPGQPQCVFYTRHGYCKFGHTCKFDHPMGDLNYSPSASSLVDMPVAPLPFPPVSGGTFIPSGGSGAAEAAASHDGQLSARNNQDAVNENESRPAEEVIVQTVTPGASGGKAEDGVGISVASNQGTTSTSVTAMGTGNMGTAGVGSVDSNNAVVYLTVPIPTPITSMAPETGSCTTGVTG